MRLRWVVRGGFGRPARLAAGLAEGSRWCTAALGAGRHAGDRPPQTLRAVLPGDALIELELRCRLR